MIGSCEKKRISKCKCFIYNLDRIMRLLWFTKTLIVAMKIQKKCRTIVNNFTFATPEITFDEKNWIIIIIV